MPEHQNFAHEADTDQAAMSPQLSRRALISSGIAAGAAALYATSAFGRAASAPKSPGLIDVHSHFYPPIFSKMWKESPDWSPNTTDPVVPLVQRWSPSWMIERMDEANVAVAVISNNDRVFTAGLPTDKRRGLAREVNEYATRLSGDYKGRIGLFAYMPMPDVDGCLREIAYALDVLKADGIHLMTSYGDKWLGDPYFDPLLAELNRRKAVVFVHPRAADCCRDLMPRISSRAPAPVLEYPYDSGRAVLSLLFSAALTKYRDIKWIFTHTGGVIPALSGRMEGLGSYVAEEEELARIAPDGIMAELRRLYWDIAFPATKPAMKALLEFTTQDKVLFGTDSPFFTPQQNIELIDKLGLEPTQRADIERTNALRLLPRLSAA